MTHRASMKPSRIELHATVTRADGTVEELGCIAFHDRNPLRRLLWRIQRTIRRIVHG